MAKKNSPYNAAFTSCSYLKTEFNAILPLLQSPDSAALLKQEAIDRQYTRINNEASAKKILTEFRRRYESVPPTFWTWYEGLEEDAQRAALLYAIIKTYRLIFDFHIHVTLKKWNSVDHTLVKDDLIMEFLDISSQDEFVDSWTAQTKDKLMKAYLTILRQADMLDKKTHELKPIRLMPSDYKYYVETGDTWFLDACLLTPMEKNEVLNSLT